MNGRKIAGRMAELFLNRRDTLFLQKKKFELCIRNIFYGNCRLGYRHIIMFSLAVKVSTRLLKRSRYVIFARATQDKEQENILLL